MDRRNFLRLAGGGIVAGAVTVILPKQAEAEDKPLRTVIIQGPQAEHLATFYGWYFAASKITCKECGYVLKDRKRIFGTVTKKMAEHHCYRTNWARIKESDCIVEY